MSSSNLSAEDVDIPSSPPTIRRKGPASLTYSSPRLPPRRFTLLSPSLRERNPQIPAPSSPIAASEGFEAQLLLARNISDDSEEDVEGKAAGLLEQEKNRVFLTQNINSDTESIHSSSSSLSDFSSTSSNNQSQQSV